MEEIILPVRLKEKFKEGLYANFLFVGSQGIGKTTLALILSKFSTVKVINASLDNGIDSVRNQIVNYCQTSSMKGEKKVMILDEADHLSPQAQASLRGTIEMFHKVAFFILTCNYPEKILDPIKSRLVVIDFNFTEKEEQEQVFGYYKRIKYICDDNNLKISADAIQMLVKKNFPDFRAIVQALQDISRDTQDIKLTDVTKTSLHSYNKELYDFLISETYPPKIYAYIKANFVNKEHECFMALGTQFLDYLIDIGKTKNAEMIPSIVHRYSYESIGVPDKLIPLLACCFEITRIFR
jgi:DNA polymerase III delta prime subunit